MPKIIKNENWRIEVFPEDFSLRKDEDFARRCRQIDESIRRHVDDVGMTNVTVDHNGYCEFCGAAWTENDDEWNGGCCDKDMDHAPPEEQS